MERLQSRLCSNCICQLTCRRVLTLCVHFRTQTWVQITKIGVAAFADAGQMVFWTTQLADGSPISAKVCLRRYYDNSGESTIWH